MKNIIKARWGIFAIWIFAAILLTIFQPDVNGIIRERGQSALSDDSQSVVANDILAKMEKTKGTNDLIVFYNKDKLTNDQKEDIGKAIKDIRDSSSELGITEMMDPFSVPAAASSLYSEDGTTLMVSMKIDKKDKTVDELKTQLNKKLDNVGVKHYLSGEDFINNDYQSKSEAGIQKSAILTVLFILVVLIIVFRSVITPVVSLLGVAFAYITANGIAGQLIDKANFPATSLTTMLLILILFGIGTDYNILLFSRFREELSHGQSTDNAIVATYKTAGKTIIYSIATVLIAFAALVLAQCPIYKSGAVVVIGAVMLLLEILTLTPFFMKTLGQKLFWPSKMVASHKENKIWGFMSTVSSKYSVVAFALVLVLIIPLSLSYKETLSFNVVGELGSSSESSEGFNLVSDHFGAGKTMTTTIVIKNDNAMDNNKAMAVIDKLTENVRKIKGVASVSSATQPEGKPISTFYLGNQLSLVADSDAFYMPKQALSDENYKQALNMFMTEDRKISKLRVILDDDPYSGAAQHTQEKVKDVLASTLEGTVLDKAEYGVAGTTATTADTNSVLHSDLQRTAVIVIVGIFLVLLLVIRSVWGSIAIVASLVGAYFTATTAMNIVFIKILGLEGISSFVPFFTFIVIIALGVDYSIFLMMRFKEYPNMPVNQAIVKACKQIGGVVMSAIIILGGTFATLVPSGMVLLAEIAVSVIVGLLMLCFVFLPIFLPAALSLPDVLKKIFRSSEIEMKDQFD